jgi:hypothetical protein
MKIFIFLLVFQLFLSVTFANPVIESQAYISELYFDENDNWTIEIYFYYLNPEYNNFRFYTSSGSADIWIFNGEVALITAADLSTPLTINRDGDFVYLTQFDDMFPLCETIVFGNYSGSEVLPPIIGESLVNVVIEDNGYYSENEYWLVKDVSPSLGYINEPVKESFSGYLTDNAGIPISYLEIDFGAMGDLPRIWTDENGYFENDSMYCKNYTIKIGSNYILEDPLTINFGSPVYREYQYSGLGQVQIDGHCFLQYASDLEGTVVYFRKNCPSWVIDSAVTDVNGYFNIDLDIGYYSLIYDHEYHFPYYSFEDNEMFEELTLSEITLEPGFVNTIIGNYQQGVWNSIYPYWILGDVIVDANDTLIIQGGCEIDFKDNFIFEIYGSLIVDGTEGDSVYFHKEAQSWTLKEYSMHLNGPTCNNSKIQYAVFQGSGAGIQFFDASIITKHSRFYDNDRSVELYGNSSPVFDSIFFNALTGYSNISVLSYEESIPSIFNSMFKSGCGICSMENSYQYVYHNTFIGSYIYCSDISAPFIYNNVFFDCIYPLQITDESEPHINNNIFYCNNYALVFGTNWVFNSIDIRYNSFWNNNADFYGYTGTIPEGLGELVTVNNNADSCDQYYNIFLDPLFVDTVNFDFHLTGFSPCIDAGNPDSPLDPDSTIADIGRYYYHQVLPYISKNESNLEYFKVFPNPANSNVIIEYAFSIELLDEPVTLKIVDIRGKEIYRNKLLQESTVNLNLGDLNFEAGAYFFILEINGQTMGVEKVIVK